MFVPEVDESAPLEAWQTVWRSHLADNLPTAGLVSLRNALVADSPSLLCGETVRPSWLNEPNVAPVGACPIAYCGWLGERLTTTEAVMRFYRQVYYGRTDDGYECGCRDFVVFVDGTPRDEMRKRLLVEVNRTLKQREADGGELATSVAERLRAGALDKGVESAA